MKPVIIFLLPALLAGCAGQQGHRGQNQPPPDQIPPDPVAEWLDERRALCEMNEDERRALLRAARDDPRGPTGPMARLLLATCQPDQTPGHLYEALEALPADPRWTASQQAFLGLVRDFTNSYRVLEKRNQELAERLEATIKGIQQIEMELDHMQPNGGTP